MTRRTPTFAAVACGLGLLIAPAVASAATGQNGIVDVPVSFQVTNTNTSRVPCSSDGAPYTVRGHLVGPRAALQASGPKAVTVYLPDLGDGDWYYNFTAVPGWNYAVQMAQLGNVSITLNSLGYAPSGQPPGTESCLGAQADVAHQVVHELRTRDYSVDAGSPAGFEQVVLAGHSIGAEIAEIEAYSWADIDGLAEMSYSDQYPSQLAITTGVDAYSRCQTAPEKANGGSGPGGYVFFDRTKEGYEHAVFNEADASPDVVAAAGNLRERAPCGDLGSIIQGAAVDSEGASEVTVPVLLVFGEADRVYPASGEPSQRSEFSGTQDVTSVILANAGSRFALEYVAPRFRAVVSRWLSDHGLVTPAAKRP